MSDIVDQLTEHLFERDNDTQMLKSAIAEINSLRLPQLVPGVLRCAKCKFQLTRTTLCMATGTVGAGNSKTETCANGCGPMWPVTWKEWAEQQAEAAERFFTKAQKLEKQNSELITVMEKSAVDIERYGAVNNCAYPLRWLTEAIAKAKGSWFEVGQKVRAKIDMTNDLREDGMGVELCANRGDELIIRRLTDYGSYAVSHEHITDRSFIAAPEELEAI